MIERWVLSVAAALLCVGAEAANYPGTITLRVDATDINRRIFRVQETIPVKPGPLTLFYPQWLPGNHAPRGPIETLAGLIMTAGGKRVEWTRDPQNVYAFHLNVPAGGKQLDVEFQIGTPQTRNQGRIAITSEILGLQWNTAVLYPSGHAATAIMIKPEIVLPEGWEFAAALDVDRRQNGTVQFKPTTLEMLVDSPVFAGRYFKRVDLDPGAATPVHLNIVADAPSSLEIQPEQLQAHRELMQQTYALFGSRHFDRYEFLFALTDHFGAIGLEHHRSSENTRSPGYFTEWDKQTAGRDLLPHELAHSWNGKFRRPADLTTSNFDVPMQDSLLWVYEGLTQYWGHVLTARAGLWTADFARESFAFVAANLDHNRPGRQWRNLQDTTQQPMITSRQPLSWVSWQRTEDYYAEGELIWLDVDTRIRELSGNKRSLDDFARAFFGIRPGDLGPVTYTFEDVVQALNSIAANDWKTFLKDRLLGHGPGAPLDGLARGGWKLVYTDKPSRYTQSQEKLRQAVDLSFSLGMVVSMKKGEAGRLMDVRWDGPAYEAGLTTGTTLIAVNGREYSADLLKESIAAAKSSKAPLELIAKDLDRYRTVRIDYTDGPRYPQLERIDGTFDSLSEILKRRTPQLAAE